MLAPGTQRRAKQALDSYLAQLPPDPEQAARLAFTLPILLRPDVLDFLQAAENIPPSQAAMQVLRYVQARIEQEPRYLDGAAFYRHVECRVIEPPHRSLGVDVNAVR